MTLQSHPRPPRSATGSALSGALCLLLLWVCATLRGVRADQCDLCADNWLIILGAGGRTGSTTALAMFRLLPGVKLSGEHGGFLVDQYEIYSKLVKVGTHTDLAWSGEPFDEHAFLCLTQELVRSVVLGAGRGNGTSGHRILGFKEIRYVTPHMLQFLVFAFPCARFIFSVREFTDPSVNKNKTRSTNQLHVIWEKERKVAAAVHAEFPNTTALLAVERLSVEMYNDILHRVLGISGCEFTAIHGENLHGGYSPGDAAEKEERERDAFTRGRCDISGVDFRLSPSEQKRKQEFWTALARKFSCGKSYCM
ncbi:hypothetical protein FVE85_8883 [Porphyridium purpureum]|uniref:Sulfotransferase n=1 Tax=Porphyridium purpureum TaxID=35688 RepID=A0A5J4YQ52_PORPP|nr:hypothetical protein FVE85_8883 [Porphyridium purpureum]|eukprot:POR1710..scf296_7